MKYKFKNGKLIRKSDDTSIWNEISNGESIKEWSSRLKSKAKYGYFEPLELQPAVITAERTPKPSGNWFQRMRNFVHPYGSHDELYQNEVNDSEKLQSKIYDIDFSDPKTLEEYFQQLKERPGWNDIESEWNKKTDEYRGKYASSVLPFKKNSNQNDILSQLWRWRSRKRHSSQNNESFSGKGTDIIDLNNNVVRLSPNSEQSTALFNEFVETKNPSVYPAKKYQSGDLHIISDRNIPVKDINLYAGVENGHYKVDSLKNFNPETVIYPVRNVKKSILPIKKFVIHKIDNESTTGYLPMIYNMRSRSNPWYYAYDKNLWPSYPTYNEDHDEYVAYRDSISSEIDKQLQLGNTLQATRLITGDSSIQVPWSYDDLKRANSHWQEKRYPDGTVRLAHDERHYYKGYRPPRLREKTDSLYKIHSRVNNYIKKQEQNQDTSYGYIDVNGQEHPISDYNASILDSKMVFGNPNGGKFIGRIQDISKSQLDSLNKYLSKNPSWLVRPDLGSFAQYRLDNPSLQDYLRQYFEHPKAEDPNVYTVGTTEPNKLWYKQGGILKRK